MKILLWIVIVAMIILTLQELTYTGRSSLTGIFITLALSIGVLAAVMLKKEK